MLKLHHIVVAIGLLLPVPETSDEWIALGARIHGAFGPFISVGKNRKTGEGLRYTIADERLPRILGWIKSDPSARYDSAMSADGLFQVESEK